jgi:hypothetical protein
MKMSNVTRIPDTPPCDKAFGSLLLICRTPVWILLRPGASVLFVYFPITSEYGFARKQRSLREVKVFFNPGDKPLSHFEASICFIFWQMAK